MKDNNDDGRKNAECKKSTVVSSQMQETTPWIEDPLNWGVKREVNQAVLSWWKTKPKPALQVSKYKMQLTKRKKSNDARHQRACPRESPKECWESGKIKSQGSRTSTWNELLSCYRFAKPSPVAFPYSKLSSIWTGVRGRNWGDETLILFRVSKMDVVRVCRAG